MKEMLVALFALYPGEMALLCVMTVLSSVGFSICVIALVASYLGDGEEDELWEN